MNPSLNSCLYYSRLEPTNQSDDSIPCQPREQGSLYLHKTNAHKKLVFWAQTGWLTKYLNFFKTNISIKSFSTQYKSKTLLGITINIRISLINLWNRHNNNMATHRYPRAHSKLSIRDHAKYPLNFTPSISEATKYIMSASALRWQLPVLSTF